MVYRSISIFKTLNWLWGLDWLWTFLLFYFPQALEPKMNFVCWNWTINFSVVNVWLFSIINNCQWNYSILFRAIIICKRSQSFDKFDLHVFENPLMDSLLIARQQTCKEERKITFKSVNQNVNPGMVSPFIRYQRMTCQHLHNFSLIYDCLVKHKFMITKDKTSKTDSLCFWQKKSIYNSYLLIRNCRTRGLSLK